MFFKNFDNHQRRPHIQKVMIKFVSPSKKYPSRDTNPFKTGWGGGGCVH
jgi:hypothetical protein